MNILRLQSGDLVPHLRDLIAEVVLVPHRLLLRLVHLRFLLRDLVLQALLRALEHVDRTEGRVGKWSNPRIQNDGVWENESNYILQSAQTFVRMPASHGVTR